MCVTVLHGRKYSCFGQIKKTIQIFKSAKMENKSSESVAEFGRNHAIKPSRPMFYVLKRTTTTVPLYTA